MKTHRHEFKPHCLVCWCGRALVTIRKGRGAKQPRMTPNTFRAQPMEA